MVNAPNALKEPISIILNLDVNPCVATMLNTILKMVDAIVSMALYWSETVVEDALVDLFTTKTKWDVFQTQTALKTKYFLSTNVYVLLVSTECLEFADNALLTVSITQLFLFVNVYHNIHLFLAIVFLSKTAKLMKSLSMGSANAKVGLSETKMDSVLGNVAIMSILVPMDSVSVKLGIKELRMGFVILSHVQTTRFSMQHWTDVLIVVNHLSNGTLKLKVVLLFVLLDPLTILLQTLVCRIVEETKFGMEHIVSVFLDANHNVH